MVVRFPTDMRLADLSSRPKRRIAGPMTKMTRQSFQAIGIGVALAALTLDQATKWLVTTLYVPLGGVELAPFLNLVFWRNSGVTFGLFDGNGEIGRWTLSALALAITLALAIWLRRAERRMLATALGLVMGGALGNVVDRVRVGAVTDFIDLHVAGRHWPAFNLADVAVVTGIAILLLDDYLKGLRKARVARRAS